LVVARTAEPVNEQGGEAGSGSRVLVGLLGAGIGQSRTPLMHMQEGARLSLDYEYRILDTDDVSFASMSASELVEMAKDEGYSGLNVTFPFKQAVLPFLDDLSPNAARIGAVNTIVFRNGQSKGHNTDLWGFAEGFTRNMDGADLTSVALFGAGGAGAAVAYALMQLGVSELLIVDLDEDRASSLSERLNAELPGFCRAAAADELDVLSLSGIVNTTPVGMEKSPGLPFSADLVQSHVWVADIIYFPLVTELLRLASLKGCRTFSGAHMAVFQAVRAFELFSGVKPDAERMRETFDAF
jgi:shikimate dehydrogenase